MFYVAQHYVIMWRSLFASSILFYLQETYSQEVNNYIQNEVVNNLIDITTSVVRSGYTIIFKNVGAESIDTYLFELRESEALVSFMNGMNETLSYRTPNKENSTSYIISLHKPLFLNEEYELTVSAIFPSKLLPATKFSRYNEEHSFMWKGNSLFFSQYYTTNYSCKFLINPSFNKNVETSVMYDSIDGDLLNYYVREIQPHSYEEMVLTFTTPLPVLKVNTLNRSIFVSKFGKIAVQDQIALQNAGPKLHGPYSNNQSDYWLFTHLPSSAESVFLSDILGTNFKRHLYERSDTKTLKFIPRYSLRQGGWKSSYTLQYNVPTHEYIFQDNDHYYLKIRVIDHILNDVMIEEAYVKIILPDGALLVDVKLPSGFVKENATSIYTSLSVSGRPVVNLRGRLLVEDDINDVIVKFDFSFFSLISAPFYIVFMLEAILLLIIFLRRYSTQ